MGFVLNKKLSMCSSKLPRAKKFKGKIKAQSQPNMLFLSCQPDPGGLGHRVINLPMCLAVTGASNPISISFNYHPLATGLCVVCPQEELVSHPQ